jgi:glycosyltransferase involved in cell wall biosynthesis
MLGNHLPRQCGIATFTSDLSQAIANRFPALETFVVAMNEAGRRHAYPARVSFEIAANDVASYRRAADFLNVNPVDVLSVQHEYGIFGGKAGSHLFALLHDLRTPIVTTLHTILSAPNPQQQHVMGELTRLSDRLVVMSAAGADLLHEVHGVPTSKIDFIPHGIPELPGAARSKRRLGLEARQVILTFGLLSPDKGIEYAIDALPEILARFPDALYVVVGGTHPHVKERHGESYRLMLEARAESLGVARSIIFHNRFVNQDELTEFLAAADLYVTPYLNPEQITSGTLAYAVGSGKPSISTPYSYARELLADGRGILVPWPREDPRGIAKAVIDLLGDAKRRATMSQRGAEFGREMHWPVVASGYVQSFERAVAEHTSRRRSTFRARTLAERPRELPEINLQHLSQLSDSTGVLQHAVFSVPSYQDGYCLDDNARALLLTALLEASGVEDVQAVRALASRYSAFVSYALDPATGRFRNFMSYGRQWIAGLGSEDCHGRALWALGAVIGSADDPGRKNLADKLFHAALPAVEGFSSPRAWAYALLGIDAYLGAFAGDRGVQAVRARLAARLFELYRQSATPDFPWFEDRATYANARLSQALLLCGWRLQDEAMKAVGLQSLRWLAAVQTAGGDEGYFAPIGSEGFYVRGKVKAAYDQQPIEACAMVSACLLAERVTEDPVWGQEARRAFQWFLGQNQQLTSLYDPATGACRDGLHADRPNENQGAESTIAFLLALVELRSASASASAQPQAPGKVRQ